MFGSWVLNEIYQYHISFFSLGWYINEFIQIISFFGVRLFLKLYCVIVIKRVAFFTIWVKLTVAFTCTSLPLNLNTSVFGCGWGFGFEQKFWQIDGFGEKRQGSDLQIPLFNPLKYEKSESMLNEHLERVSIYCRKTKSKPINRLLSQSQSLVNQNQNQSNGLVTFYTQLKTTLNQELLHNLNMFTTAHELLRYHEASAHCWQHL